MFKTALVCCLIALPLNLITRFVFAQESNTERVLHDALQERPQHEPVHSEPTTADAKSLGWNMLHSLGLKSSLKHYTWMISNVELIPIQLPSDEEQTVAATMNGQVNKGAESGKSKNKSIASEAASSEKSSSPPSKDSTPYYLLAIPINLPTSDQKVHYLCLDLSIGASSATVNAPVNETDRDVILQSAKEDSTKIQIESIYPTHAYVAEQFVHSNEIDVTVSPQLMGFSAVT